MAIDKAKQKRFFLVCKNRDNYSLWRLMMIGYSAYLPCQLPRIKGPRSEVKAWRGHAADLIKIYAPKKRLTCGHVMRGDDCTKCAEENIRLFEQYKAKWLNDKGMTEEQWRSSWASEKR